MTAEEESECAAASWSHRSPLEGERVRRFGIVVTTPARTIVDLADVVPRRRTLERAIDEAEYLGPRLEARHGPRQGRKRLRAPVLSARCSRARQHRARCRSSRRNSWRSATRHGFPRPEVNVSIEGYLCDFVWREQRLIVETDGGGAHGTTRAQAARSRPRRGPQIAGWQVIRITYNAAVERAGRGGGSARAALAHAGTCSARRTASTVTIPRSTPSPSTAMIAPSRARPSWVSRLSSGSSSRTRRPLDAVVACHHAANRPGVALLGRHALDAPPSTRRPRAGRSSPPPGTTASRSAGRSRARRRHRRVLGDRHGLGVHHVGHADVLDAPRELRLRLRRARRAGEEEADEGEPEPPTNVRPATSTGSAQRRSSRTRRIAQRGREARGPVAVAR